VLTRLDTKQVDREREWGVARFLPINQGRAIAQQTPAAPILGFGAGKKNRRTKDPKAIEPVLNFPPGRGCWGREKRHIGANDGKKKVTPTRPNGVK